MDNILTPSSDVIDTLNEAFVPPARNLTIKFPEPPVKFSFNARSPAKQPITLQNTSRALPAIAQLPSYEALEPSFGCSN